ncbi:hypothetical protein EVAR_2373_1 [Eumeta japonica]|uniref:Uncharacterized protein n=1 Tax=Eumeta variegata TaxID=151549 RepID=A0A4C1SG52_EUMVA|nr:hypothetical protein EVAR_2373_1 [Eumeta japonica]
MFAEQSINKFISVLNDGSADDRQLVGRLGNSAVLTFYDAPMRSAVDSEITNNTVAKGKRLESSSAVAPAQVQTPRDAEDIL